MGVGDIKYCAKNLQSGPYFFPHRQLLKTLWQINNVVERLHGNVGKPPKWAT
jgi:hypothetical protein